MEGLLENVLCIQRHISNTFRNGQRLHDVIQRLKNGEVDPMKDDWLVLRISKATWYDRSSGQHVTRYYTYDHRRLYCIWMAGCSKVRARIELNCPAFSELARKAHRLGTRLEPLAFKCWCCVLSVELHHRVAEPRIGYGWARWRAWSRTFLWGFQTSRGAPSEKAAALMLLPW